MRVSREISLGSSLHRASTDALIIINIVHETIVHSIPATELLAERKNE